MSDSLDNVLIADLDGKGTDDIVRYVHHGLSSVQWQVSVGGRTPWQPLAQTPFETGYGGVLAGHFDGSNGAQILAIGPGEGRLPSILLAYGPDNYRRSLIFSRATGQFTPYGKYSY